MLKASSKSRLWLICMLIAVFGALGIAIALTLFAGLVAGIGIAVIIALLALAYFAAIKRERGDTVQPQRISATRSTGPSSEASSRYDKALDLIINGDNDQYRPQILVLTGNPAARPGLVDLAANFTRSSLLLCGYILQEPVNNRIFNKEEKIDRHFKKWMAKREVKGELVTVASDTMAMGTSIFMQTVGIGLLKPNILMMGFKTNWAKKAKEGMNEIIDYYKTIEVALSKNVALVIFRNSCCGLDHTESMRKFQINLHDLDIDNIANKNDLTITANAGKILRKEMAQDELSSEPLPRASGSSVARFKTSTVNTEAQMFVNELRKFRYPVRSGVIDVWWLQDNGGMAMFLPYLLTQEGSYLEGAKIRVFISSQKCNDPKLQTMLTKLRKYGLHTDDLHVLSTFDEMPAKEIQEDFASKIQYLNNDLVSPGQGYTSNRELKSMEERTMKYLRIAELLRENSGTADMIVVTLPQTRAEEVSPTLLMAWLDVISDRLPPVLLDRPLNHEPKVMALRNPEAHMKSSGYMGVPDAETGNYKGAITKGGKHQPDRRTFGSYGSIDSPKSSAGTRSGANGKRSMGSGYKATGNLYSSGGGGANQEYSDGYGSDGQDSYSGGSQSAYGGDEDRYSSSSSSAPTASNSYPSSSGMRPQPAEYGSSSNYGAPPPNAGYPSNQNSGYYGSSSGYGQPGYGVQQPAPGQYGTYSSYTVPPQPAYPQQPHTNSYQAGYETGYPSAPQENIYQTAQPSYPGNYGAPSAPSSYGPSGYGQSGGYVAPAQPAPTTDYNSGPSSGYGTYSSYSGSPQGGSSSGISDYGQNGGGYGNGGGYESSSQGYQNMGGSGNSDYGASSNYGSSDSGYEGGASNGGYGSDGSAPSAPANSYSGYSRGSGNGDSGAYSGGGGDSNGGAGAYSSYSGAGNSGPNNNNENMESYGSSNNNNDNYGSSGGNYQGGGDNTYSTGGAYGSESNQDNQGYSSYSKMVPPFESASSGGSYGNEDQDGRNNYGSSQGGGNQNSFSGSQSYGSSSSTQPDYSNYQGGGNEQPTSNYGSSSQGGDYGNYGNGGDQGGFNSYGNSDNYQSGAQKPSPSTYNSYAGSTQDNQGYNNNNNNNMGESYGSGGAVYGGDNGNYGPDDGQGGAVYGGQGGSAPVDYGNYNGYSGYSGQSSPTTSNSYGGGNQEQDNWDGGNNYPNEVGVDIDVDFNGQGGGGAYSPSAYSSYGGQPSDTIGGYHGGYDRVGYGTIKRKTKGRPRMRSPTAKNATTPSYGQFDGYRKKATATVLKKN
ncbi:unnamed protein product, partial [Mesorhabditis spiculigera]